MAVSTTYATIEYSGNGSTTVFAVSWPFFTGTLVVTLIAASGARTVQTLTTHYTVSGGTDANGLPATGSVVMLTAPASGETLEIKRATPVTQPSVWSDAAAFPAKTIEAALDRRALIEQELDFAASDAVDEITFDVGSVTTGSAGSAASVALSGTYPDYTISFTIPRGDAGLSGPGTGDVIGPASATDSGIVLFDGTSGTLIKNSGYTITAAGAALLDDATAAAQRATLGLGTLSTLSSVATANVDNNAITLAKLVDATATARVLMRKTAGAGDWEEGTLSEVLDLIGSATKGDILVRDTASWAKIAAGTAGYVLTANGAGALPTYQVATNTGWEKIGATTIGGAVASVEHTFTAATYSQVMVVFSDISCATGSDNIVATLRNAGGAIVTLTASSAFAAAEFASGWALFSIGRDAATKVSHGEMRGYGGTAGLVSAEAGGANATAADRVRLSYSVQNIDDGIITVYGLKV